MFGVTRKAELRERFYIINFDVTKVYCMIRWSAEYNGVAVARV